MKRILLLVLNESTVAVKIRLRFVFFCELAPPRRPSFSRDKYLVARIISAIHYFEIFVVDFFPLKTFIAYLVSLLSRSSRVVA